MIVNYLTSIDICSPQQPPDILHDKNGLTMREYPSFAIHVFEKDPSSVGPGVFIWKRVDNLGTHSLFIGLNYPMNLKINDGNGTSGTLTPFLRKNCVYISYGAFRITEYNYVSRYNLQPGEGELMGVISFPKDGWGRPEQAAMWFKPSLDNIRMLINP